jgi:hypothetical protein
MAPIPLLPQAPGMRSRQVGPPNGGNVASLPGAAETHRKRRTVTERPLVSPRLSQEPESGFKPTDRYVREYLIPLVGPGAVADLLRLTAAAHSGRPIRLPINLSTLIREGLAKRTPDASVLVPAKVQQLGTHQVARLPPALRRSHKMAHQPAGQPTPAMESTWPL